MRCWLLISISLLLLTASGQKQAAGAPRFADYPVTETFRGKPAPPIFTTAEQRRFRTRIRNGVFTGSDVWTGSWKNPVKREGPNFAGHYFIIRWGCGSQCVLMATVDAKTGFVYAAPLSGAGRELYVPLDNLSDMEVDFRLDSSLLVLRNACRDFKNRASCGVYYLNWKDDRFSLIKFTAVDPLYGRY